MESFFIKPDKEYWEKTEFFSELKLDAVSDENYENSKYLYLTLKMRNLGDLLRVDFKLCKILMVLTQEDVIQPAQ